MPFPTAYPDLDFLDLVVIGSFLLLAMSLANMSYLILNRAYQNRRKRQQHDRIRDLTSLALGAVDDPIRIERFPTDLRRGDRKLLIGILNNLLPKVKGDYAIGLIDLMRSLNMVEEALARLRSRFIATRVEAANALSYFPERRVTDALRRALDDRAYEVRVAAARSLVRLKAVPSVTAMLEKLATAKGKPSLAVTDLLSALDSASVGELMDLVREPGSDEVKILAVEALGHIGDLQAVPALLSGYNKAGRPVRVTILGALANLVHPAALSLVLSALNDPHWEIRTKAAICAGKLGDRKTLEPLACLLSDPHWWVRFYAAEALLLLGPEGAETLRQTSAGGEFTAAEIASGLLREKGLTPALPT